MSSEQQLADRYVAAWNETDPDRRREQIADLFASEGVHYVASRDVRGYAALEQRIIESHEKWVSQERCRFRAVDNAQRLQDVVTFNWEMVGNDGAIRSVGLEFVEVDDNDCIVADYQFNVS